MRITFVFLFALIGLSCGQQGAVAQKVLQANEFAAMLAQDQSVQLVDVRTPEEYAAGHLQGARLMDIYDTSFAQQIGKLDKSKPVMVYCAAGTRSAAAARQMQKMGFRQVYDLDGGINAWRSAGKPTVQ